MSNPFNSYTKPSNFTTIPNELIRSSTLSCKAFKLLCLGLSHSGGWHFSKAQMATCFKEGMTTLETALKELREAGYLHTTPKKGKDGKIRGYNWFWFESPRGEDEFNQKSGEAENPVDGESRHTECTPPLRIPILKKTNTYKKEEQEEQLKAAVLSLGSDGLVNLSQEQLDSLKEVIPDLGGFIEELNDYIAATGKKYNCHAAVLRQWHRRSKDTAGKATGHRAKINKQTSNEQRKKYNDIF